MARRFSFQVAAFRPLARLGPAGWLLALMPLLALAGCASAPRAYVEPPPLAATERPAHNLEVFERARELVDEKYFDPAFRGRDWRALGARYRPLAAAARDDAALYRVLNDLCGELGESHLVAIPPRRTHERKTDLRFGVGMGWRRLEANQVVTELVPGGPAEAAGVEVGWIIVSRNGVPLDQLAGTPPPRPGEPVTYGFLDLENQPRSIVFAPQLLRYERLEARDLPGGFRYLRFDRFDRESLRWLGAQLKAFPDAPGVVIDLRDNLGGTIYACQAAVNQFFPDRVSSGRFVRRGGAAHESKGWSFFGADYRGRVLILTSGATGSAAEIFAHVLQFRGRATVVGRPTAGAVILSRTYALPGGGSLQVPIQDYRGLDGRRLEGHGVMPDVPLAVPVVADLRAGRDSDLSAALTLLRTKDPRNIASAARQPAREAFADTVLD
ncbi:MAG TPA: S41 family peptidase [Opitutaceae bacterium]|nr:S41 family peptidase [Opitutaceae bacterium]